MKTANYWRIIRTMSKIKTLMHLMKHDSRMVAIILWGYCRRTKISHLLSDKAFLKLTYRISFGETLQLKNPQTFNEKLQWLKLYYRKPEFTELVDKFKVKEYIAGKIGEEYVIPTLGCWDDFGEIDFDTLPNKFVLKCTHDSGSTIVCRDKKTLDKEAIKKKYAKRLKKNKGMIRWLF